MSPPALSTTPSVQKKLNLGGETEGVLTYEPFRDIYIYTDRANVIPYYELLIFDLHATTTYNLKLSRLL